MSLSKNSKAINQVKEVTRDDPPLPSTPGNAWSFLLGEPVSSVSSPKQDSKVGRCYGDWPSLHQELTLQWACWNNTPVGDHSQMKLNCFPSCRKIYCSHLERLHPMNISVIFSSTDNELGSLIHTLNKISQIWSACSEAPVEATKNNNFRCKSWLAWGRHSWPWPP